VAIYGYHSQIVKFTDGIKTIAEVAKIGLPKLSMDYGAQTAMAFAFVEQLLQAELPNLQHSPAPLICHLTDGQYGGPDPEPIVSRIQHMAVPDGNVLVENIFISKSVLKNPVNNSRTWPGVTDSSQILEDKKYARKLFAMSSVIPSSYLSVMNEFGYNIQPGAKMLFPGDTPDFIEMGFAMSGATPITR
jgi:hypothetical protein